MPVLLTGVRGAADHELRRMWSCCWRHVQSGRRTTDTSVSTSNTSNSKKCWNL